MIKTFNLVSLGCPKNLVDSEVMYGLLEQHGWKGVDDPADAALLVVNTCGFIQPAVEESIEEILQLLEYKNINPDTKLAVTGCLVQRYDANLKRSCRRWIFLSGRKALASYISSSSSFLTENRQSAWSFRRAT